MSNSAAIIGKGVTIGSAADATSAPTTYVSFLEIKDVTPPKMTVGEPKVTHYLSPSTANEFIPGWLDAGEVEVKGNYIAADRTTLEGMVGVMKWFKIQLPPQAAEVTGGNWACRGFIKALGGEIPMEEAIQTTFSLKLSGKPIWTAGT